MVNDEARQRGVHSFLTQEARLGGGPMIAVMVNSTREAILMDANEPIQGAIEQYIDDLADRALFRDAILAALELNRSERYADMLDLDHEVNATRKDLKLGDIRVHAVFEGMRYGADDAMIYGFNKSKRDPETGMPANDCQTPERMGLPLIEFFNESPDWPYPDVAIATIPATDLLGYNGAGRDLKKLGLSGTSFELRGGDAPVRLSPSEAIAVASWAEKASAFRLDASRNPASFAVMYADRYELIYETNDSLQRPEDVSTFDTLLNERASIAINSVGDARGDKFMSDRECAAFTQVLDVLADDLKEKTFAAMGGPSLASVTEVANETARRLNETQKPHGNHDDHVKEAR